MPEIPTPPASSVAPSQHASPLPQPRKHPLKPGGPRESDLIRYLDHGVNRIQKRVDNRMTNRKLKPVPGEEEGYKAFWEVAKDLDGLVDVVWVSGSRMLPALVRETSFANIKICSQSPNSLPTELRRPHRRLPPSLRVLNAFCPGYLPPTFEARLRLLLPTHWPRHCVWRISAWL